MTGKLIMTETRGKRNNRRKENTINDTENKTKVYNKRKKSRNGIDGELTEN